MSFKVITICQLVSFLFRGGVRYTESRKKEAGSEMASADERNTKGRLRLVRSPALIGRSVR